MGDDPTPSAGVAATDPAPRSEPLAPGGSKGSVSDEAWNRLASDEGAESEPPAPEDPPAEPEPTTRSDEGEGDDDEAKGVGDDEEEESEEEKEEAKPKEGKDEEKPRARVSRGEADWVGKALDRCSGLPGVKEAIRDTYHALEAYQEAMPSVREARERIKIHPTFEDARDDHGKARALDGFNDRYWNRPEELVSALLADDPRSFVGFLRSIPRALISFRDPSTREIDHRPFRVLAGLMGREMFDNLESRFKEDTEEGDAVRMVRKLALGNGKAADEGRREADDPVVRENRAFRAREEERAETDLKSRVESINLDYHRGMERHVEAWLDVPFKQGSYPDGARERIIGEILDAVAEEALVRNRDLARELRGGGFDTAKKKEIVAKMLARGKGLVRVVGPEILSNWSGIITGGSKNKNSQRERIASRRDPGTGGHQGPGAKPRPAIKSPGNMSPAEKESYFGKGGKGADPWAKLDQPST